MVRRPKSALGAGVGVQDLLEVVKADDRATTGCGVEDLEQRTVLGVTTVVPGTEAGHVLPDSPRAPAEPRPAGVERVERGRVPSSVVGMRVQPEPVVRSQVENSTRGRSALNATCSYWSVTAGPVRGLVKTVGVGFPRLPSGQSRRQLVRSNPVLVP